MVDLSPTMRVRRGFHRTGIGVAAVLAVCTFAIGATISTNEVKSQQSRSLAVRCAYDRMASLLSPRAGPWEEFRAGIVERRFLLIQAEKRGILRADQKPKGYRFKGGDPAQQDNWERLPDDPWTKFKPSAPPPDYVIDRPQAGAEFGWPIGVADGRERESWPGVPLVHIGKMGCGDSFLTATVDEILASQNSGFSYIIGIASYLGLTALVTGLVGLAAYFSIAGFSWIVRGFMRD